MLLSNTTFPFLAEPLPDEMLSSVIFRSARMMGMNNYAFCKETIGSQMTSLFFYPFLDSFSDFEGVLNMTVYPYFFSVIGKEQKEEALKLIKEGTSIGTLFPSYPAKGLKKQKLWYCPKCLESDLQKYGTGYFRLYHQYDGIKCCTDHKVKLVECNKKFSEVSLDENDLVYPEKASALDVEEASLIQTVSKMDYEELSSCYKASLDYMKGSPRSKKARVMENCKKIPMNFKVSMNTHRYKFLVGEGYQSCHPYFHIMMIKALALEIGSAEEVLAKPAKKCRNPYCHSLKTRLMGTNSGENDYWKCEDCGCVFSTVRIMQLGINGKKLIERQEEEKGTPRRTVIKELGTTWENYKKLMTEDPEMIDKEIEANRAKVEVYTGRTELHDKDNPTYNFLRRFDSEWLEQRFPAVTHKRRKFKMDEDTISSRDVEVLSKVKTAFEDSKDKDIWISKNYLKKVAGVRKDNSYMKKYFPETFKFIEENGETKEAYWIRRVKLFVDSYSFDQPLTPKVLKKELGRSPYIQTAYRLLKNYIKEKEREKNDL